MQSCPKVKCECGHETECLPEEAGRMIQCISCGRRVMVPAAAAAPAASAAPNESEKKMISCPFCSEMIPTNVSRCPQCSEFLKNVSTGGMIKASNSPDIKIKSLDALAGNEFPLKLILVMVFVLLAIGGVIAYVFVLSGGVSAKWRGMLSEGQGPEHDFKYKFKAGELITYNFGVEMSLDLVDNNSNELASMSTEMLITMFHKIKTVDAAGNADSEMSFGFRKLKVDNRNVLYAIPDMSKAKIFTVIDSKGRSLPGSLSSKDLPPGFDFEDMAAQFLVPIPNKPLKEGAVLPLKEVMSPDALSSVVPVNNFKNTKTDIEGIFMFKEILQYETVEKHTFLINRV
ncbi:MAG: hypothetical protein ABIH42_00980 [Planctomycetota bacterium]